MPAVTTTDVYSPIADLVTIAICWILVVLILCSYIRRTRSYRLFLIIVGALMFAAYASILYRTLLSRWQPAYTVPICISRLIMHISMFTVMHFFVIYIGEVSHLTIRERRISAALAGFLLLGVTLYDLIGTITGSGFSISPDGAVHTGVSIFSYGYIAFVILNGAMLLRVRTLLYKRIMAGFFFTVTLSIVMNFAQRFNGQSSFTVVTFLFPVLAMLYLLHSNPYDSRLGAVGQGAMKDYVRNARAKNRPFGYMSLYMPDLGRDDAVIPDDLLAVMRGVSTNSFRNSLLFDIGRGHYILVYPLKKNPDAESRVSQTLEIFAKAYSRFRLDYKLVIGRSAENTANEVDYASFIWNLHHSMKMNTIHRVDSQDSSAYDRYARIQSQLLDICSRHNPDDPRVLVYCQPVYDLAKKRYDTAEALMRLNLDGIGMVFPDEFIHLAEENGTIHVLTEIILNKTCKQVHRLLQEGFFFSRISVNVAAQELKENTFCRDIMRIIDCNEITADRIALELTESENESDFLVAQEKISELRAEGVQFYLDDFGTGYSSMERIMQLPFDIIKFDRSLVLASAADAKSAAIVRNMARLFRDLDYSILFEGIEDESDEARCSEMSASYLQGYKYSRPIPIEQLVRFFTKAEQ